MLKCLNAIILRCFNPVHQVIKAFHHSNIKALNKTHPLSDMKVVYSYFFDIKK